MHINISPTRRSLLSTIFHNKKRFMKKETLLNSTILLFSLLGLHITLSSTNYVEVDDGGYLEINYDRNFNLEPASKDDVFPERDTSSFKKINYIKATIGTQN